MTRPTRPPGGPPYPGDEDDGQQPRPQPRFTPRPPPAPPPAPPPEPAQAPLKPTFTPHRQPRDAQPRDGRYGARHVRGNDQGTRPRPTFTPRAGYVPPPPDAQRRAAYPPPTTFMPAPPGYPQQSFPQPFGYPEALLPPAPRFVPADRRPGRGEDNRTRVPARGAGELSSTGPQRAVITGPNLAQSSKVMALGTVVSRGTGFLRTFVLVAALGSSQLANAYNNSNTLPNTVYYLMLGGIFTSVVVPLLVQAAKEDPDRGAGYAERIFTLGVISLLAVTVIATLLAGPLVDLYAGNVNGPSGTLADAQHHLMVIWAYYFIPQIFFYGMDSLLGAILNVRGRFGPNMWTPVINNVVVIIIGALYIATVGLHKTPTTISSGAVQLLGVGTTLGIVIQSVALFPVLRRAGFSMRLRWDLRRSEIGEIGRVAGWMFGYVVSQWVGNLVVQRFANIASGRAAAAAAAAAAAHAHAAHLTAAQTAAAITAATTAAGSAGYSAYSYAWQLFQLPYAIVGISVISALLPRMSGHASDRRYSLVRDDFSKGVRVASVIVVPAAVFLGALGSPLCELLFSVGSNSARNAQYIGEVFGVFSLGLVPFMLTQLQLRVFYSFHENRTPAVIGMVMLAIGVIGDVAALSVLPAGQVVIGLAAAYDFVTLTGAVLAWPLLLRQVGSLDGWRITRSLVRMFLATVPGLIFALVIMAVAGSLLRQGPLYGFVVTLIGGGGALLLYAICSRVLGIEEFRTLMRSVGGRFG